MIEYKYRVAERTADGRVVRHNETSSEDDAKKMVAYILRHNNGSTCRIERFNGERWQVGKAKYFWFVDQVCYHIIEFIY